MKYLISFLFAIIAFTSIAQTGSVTVKSNNTKTYNIQDVTWSMSIPVDTMSGLNTPDTLVISGDTILTDWPDTLLINIPFDLYDSYNGQITIKTDTISGETALTISKVICYTAPCASCQYTKISEDNSAPYTFTVPDLRLRLVIIATAGTGKISARITLK